MSSFSPLRKSDGYLPLEDHNLIVDGTTAALVARDGAVTWIRNAAVSVYALRRIGCRGADWRVARGWNTAFSRWPVGSARSTLFGSARKEALDVRIGGLWRR